jgi:hypothetical protein
MHSKRLLEAELRLYAKKGLYLHPPSLHLPTNQDRNERNMFHKNKTGMLDSIWWVSVVWMHPKWLRRKGGLVGLCVNTPRAIFTPS